MKVDTNLIRTERERRAWSQEHLSSVSGLSLRTIQRIEATGLASFESAKALASVLEIELATLSADPSRKPVSALQSTAQLPGQSRRKPKFELLLPSILLAIGLLGSTGIAKLSHGQVWWLGALAMAATMVIAKVLDDLIKSRKSDLRPTWIVALAFIFACALQAVADPAGVAIVIALLGAVPVILFNSSFACRRRRDDGPSPA